MLELYIAFAAFCFVWLNVEMIKDINEREEKSLLFKLKQMTGPFVAISMFSGFAFWASVFWPATAVFCTSKEIGRWRKAKAAANS